MYSTTGCWCCAHDLRRGNAFNNGCWCNVLHDLRKCNVGNGQCTLDVLHDGRVGGRPHCCVGPPSLESRCCGCCRCCCWQVHHDVQSIFTARFGLSCSSFLSPFLPLCLFGCRGLHDPTTVSSRFGCSSGCSPDSSTASRRPHVWSTVHSDPPCVSPPCDDTCSTLHSHALNSHLLQCVVLSTS